ncbi:hypothetical protein BUALT_Bualt06G0079400 [Buddleja alternifolia]|uniref:pectinesterase n=1 Tax=Buddleja alternifolia TaxID=168488 RepID=A0AAV6XPF2_9LAMI|nr:hypothetical protein BUALT_Bualt06G0079400 [Buddleja alternifolia]
MSQKMSNIAIEMVLVTILLFVSITHSDDNVPIPADKSHLNSWFYSNVGQLSARNSSLLPDIASAEANVKVIKVRADGSGDFKTINDVVKSIPIGNKNRNSAPRPDGKTKDPMTAALRISGEFASFYSRKFYGFQDTLCDDKGKHFFKDCYVEGTVDFAVSGKSTI